MKKYFLFYKTTSFALEPRFLTSHFFQKGGIPFKKVLSASVLAAVLGYSTATFGMNPEDEENKQSEISKKVGPNQTDQYAALLENIKRFYALTQRIKRGPEKEENDAEHKRTLKKLVKFYDPEFYNNYKNEKTRQESYDQAFFQLTEWHHTGMILIVTAEDPPSVISYQRNYIKDVYVEFLTKYGLSLIQHGKPSCQPVKQDTTKKQQKKTPAKNRFQTKIEKTASEKKDLPEDNKDVTANKSGTTNTSKTLVQLLMDEKNKKENEAHPLPARKSLVIEAQTPLQALETWISAQRYKQKPTYQFKETKREGPGHALCITYEATLDMPGTGKKKLTSKIGVGTGVGSTKNEAKDNAIQNLVDILEGKISIEPKISNEPKRENTKPKNDSLNSKLSTINPQSSKGIDSLKIHMHPITSDGLVPKKIVTSTLPKPEEQKSNKMESTSNPPLSKASSTQDSKDHRKVSPKQSPASSQQQQASQDPEPSMTPGAANLKKSSKKGDAARKKGDNVIETVPQSPLKKKEKPMVYQTLTQGIQILSRQNPLKAAKLLSSSQIKPGIDSKKIENEQIQAQRIPQKMNKIIEIVPRILMKKEEKKEETVREQTVVTTITPVSSTSALMKAVTSPLSDKNTKQVIKDVQPVKPSLLRFLPTREQVQQHYEALKFTGHTISSDSDFAPWTPIARSLLNGRNVPFGQPINSEIVLIPLKEYMTYIESVPQNHLEAIPANLAPSPQARPPRKRSASVPADFFRPKVK